MADVQSSARPGRSRARFQPWLQAARPVAYPMIFVPLALGQVMAFNVHGSFSGTLLLAAAVFGALFQVQLVYVNDVADEAVDRTNDRAFLSGGSRVLVDGKLEPGDLRLGAGVAIVALAGLAAWLALAGDRPWFLPGAGLAVALGWAYNLGPLKLSHRGHGEIVQGLGCGVVLPLIGFYLQHGSLQGFPWAALVPLYAVFHAGHIVTALPDAPSDRAGGKRTFPARQGEARARRAVLITLTAACVGVVLVSLDLSWPALVVVVVPAGALLAMAGRSGRIDGDGPTEGTAFAACKRFVAWASASQAWLLCAWLGALWLDGFR